MVNNKVLFRLDYCASDLSSFWKTATLGSGGFAAHPHPEIPKVPHHPPRIRSSLISMKFLCTLLRHQFREGPIGGILQNVSCFLGLQNYKYSDADKIIIIIIINLGPRRKGLSDAHFHVTFSTAFIKIAGKSLITASSQSNSQ